MFRHYLFWAQAGGGEAIPPWVTTLSGYPFLLTVWWLDRKRMEKAETKIDSLMERLLEMPKLLEQSTRNLASK
jgi:hypothetical protein